MLDFPQISVVFGYLIRFTWDTPKRLLENAECVGRAVSLGVPLLVTSDSVSLELSS